MIDQARLQELEDDFGAEDLGELIEVFLAETWEGLDTLASLIQDCDPTALREQLHFLKGCALNVGASAFAERCHRHEKSEQPVTAADLQGLRTEFQSVCDWFSAGDLRRSA